MRLTKQTNYSLRILMYCAASKGLSKISDIAEFYDLPQNFLFKILQQLTAGELVESVRGRNGGIKLARPANEIGVGDVVRLMEERFDMAECFETGTADCPLVMSCGLNEALNRALGAFFDVLDEYTIHDLTNNKRNIRVLMQLEEFKNQPLETIPS